MKISVNIATSLDGYIARPDGGLDWLPQPGDPTLEPGEDYGFQAFMNSIDSMIMGRNTFDMVLSFGGEWPYGDKRVLVLSNRPVTIPPELTDRVEAMAGTPAEIVARLEALGAEHVYIDGGMTIQNFLRAGLIDQLGITTIPILIGRGLPLFGDLAADIKLTHQETKSYANGLVQTRYAIQNS